MIKIDEADPIGEVDPSFPYKDVTIKKNTDMKQFYDLQKEIGRGKFGTVYRCTEKSTGLKLAAKFIGISKRQDRRNAEREVDIMRELQHPRLIQMYDAYEINNVMCVVLELIEGGELFERVIDDDFILTEKSVSIFMRQICEGIAFIHSKNILHLDMKPENILCLTRTGNRIKIIDFGLARKYDPEKKLQVLFGTPEFVAPEVVNFDSIGFGTDMWSVGVICYVLLSGLSPFMGETDVQTMANVTIAQYDFDDEAFNDISADAKDFIGKLLLKDREQRMSATECLSHRWLQRRKQVSDVTPSSNPIPQNNELDLQRDTLRYLVDRWNNETNITLVANMDEKPEKIVDICKINGITEEQSKLQNGVSREINLDRDKPKKLSLKIEETKNTDEAQSPSPVPKKQLKLETALLPIQPIETPVISSQFLKPLSDRVITTDALKSMDPEAKKEVKNDTEIKKKDSKFPTSLSLVASSPGEHDRKTSKSPTPQSSVPSSPGECDRKLSKSPTPSNFVANHVSENGPTPLSPVTNTVEERDRKMSKSPTLSSFYTTNTETYDKKMSKSPTPLNPFSSTLLVHDPNTSTSPSPSNSGASSPEANDRKTFKSPTPLSPVASTLRVHDRKTPLSFIDNSSGEHTRKVSKSPTPVSSLSSTVTENDRKTSKSPTLSSTIANSSDELDRKMSKSPTPLSSLPSSPAENEKKASKSSTPPSTIANSSNEFDRKMSKSPTPLSSLSSSPAENGKKTFKSPTLFSIVNNPEEHGRKVSKSPTPLSSLSSSPGEGFRKTSKSPTIINFATNSFGDNSRKTSKSPTPQSSNVSSPSVGEQPIFSISLNSSSDSISIASESETNQKSVFVQNDNNKELTKIETTSKANSCDNAKETCSRIAVQPHGPKIVNTSPSPPPQCSTAQENNSASNSSDNPNDIPSGDKPSLRTPTVEISDESYECVKKRRFVIKNVESKETHESTKTLQCDKPSSSRTSPSRGSPFSAEEDIQSRIQRKADDFASPSELMKRRISDISTFLKSNTMDQSISEEMSSFCNRLNRIVRLRHDSYSIDSDGMSFKRPKFRISYFSRDVPLATSPPYHADLLNYLPLCDETIATPVWSFQKTNPFHSDPSSLRNSPERFATPFTKKILSKFFKDSLEYDISSTPSTSNGMPKDKITGIIS